MGVGQADVGGYGAAVAVGVGAAAVAVAVGYLDARLHSPLLGSLRNSSFRETILRVHSRKT